MTSRLILLAMTAAIAGHATSARSPAAQPAPFIAIERGQALAERRCGGCHAVGPTGQSAQTMAPPFRDLGLRYNAISFERRMAGLTSRGITRCRRCVWNGTKSGISRPTSTVLTISDRPAASRTVDRDQSGCRQGR